MKLKQFFSILTSLIIMVSFAATTAFAAEDDYILVDEDMSGTNWGQVFSLQKPGFDVSIIKKDCNVVVEYTGGSPELIFQSWTNPDGEFWGRLAPTADSDGVAVFSYDDMNKIVTKTLKSDWKYVDGFHINATAKDITVHKAYITMDEIKIEEEPKVEEPKEEEPKVEEPKEEKPKEEKPKEETKKPETKDIIPTISFDSKNWTNYLKLTPDAKIANIELDQTSVDSYQATSLVVNAKMTEQLTGKYPTYAKLIYDSDGKMLYPDSKKEDAEIVHMGFELNASDFGLESFNGCTIQFAYLFNETAASVLMGESMYVYPADEEYQELVKTPKSFKVDTITRGNIDYYDPKGFVNVPEQQTEQNPATKVIFELPITSGFEGEVLRMDNIVINLPDGTIAENVDDYNSSFEIRNQSDGKIKPGSAQTIEVDDSADETDTAPKETKKKFNPMIIVVIVLVLVAVGLGAGIVIKNKNRYY